MREICTYYGHSIDLDVQGLSFARVQWTYFIDDRYCMQGTLESMPIDAARANALALAHRSIDVLDAMGSGG